MIFEMWMEKEEGKGEFSRIFIEEELGDRGGDDWVADWPENDRAKIWGGRVLRVSWIWFRFEGAEKCRVSVLLDKGGAFQWSSNRNWVHNCHIFVNVDPLCLLLICTAFCQWWFFVGNLKTLQEYMVTGNSVSAICFRFSVDQEITTIDLSFLRVFSRFF
jgi:hypothetical protein